MTNAVLNGHYVGLLECLAAFSWNSLPSYEAGLRSVKEMMEKLK